MIYNVETFVDSYDTTKQFHHVTFLGFKFRIATNERRFKRVNTKHNPKNRNPSKYYCLITK